MLLRFSFKITASMLPIFCVCRVGMTEKRQPDITVKSGCPFVYKLTWRSMCHAQMREGETAYKVLA